MPVHDVERSGQALAAFLVEVLDRHSQLADRLHQIVALGHHLVAAGLDFGQLVVGAQVHGAKALAVALQFFKLAGDRVDLGQLVAGRNARHRGQAFRRAFQIVGDGAHDVFVTLAQAFHARFGAGALLAHMGHGVERKAGDAVGFGQLRFGLRAIVGGELAAFLGLVDLVDESATTLQKQLGGFRQFHLLFAGL